MARKLFFFIFFICSFIFFNNNISFCVDTLPTIDLEQSQSILDFGLNISKRTNSSFKNALKTSTATGFMKFFNDNVAPKFYNSSNGEIDNSLHFTFYFGEWSTLYVLVTNAEHSNNLDFITIDYRSYEVYKIHSQYIIEITFNGNNSFASSNVRLDSYESQPLFYNGNTAISTPQYDEDFTTLITPNLFYLGPKAWSDVSFKAPGSSSYSWYFLEHCYGGSVTPSGDTPSGDTPSGDTPSGDTPNYDDKLDNISGLITNTNSKLDGISGEIGQTNNKLDGISGELGEINDNLTTVPDLSGTTINSGDIESALNFDFAEDPYSNFWFELNTGLSSALTSSNRSININFRNKIYTISLDDFSLQVPEFLKSFLAIISTVLVVWQIVRYIKIMIDKISSGNMDTVLAMNEEERNS